MIKVELTFEEWIEVINNIEAAGGEFNCTSAQWENDEKLINKIQNQLPHKEI